MDQIWSYTNSKLCYTPKYFVFGVTLTAYLDGFLTPNEYLTVSKPCKGLQIIRSTMVDSAPRFDYLNPIILFYIYVREFLREFVLQELLLDNPYFLYLPPLNPLPLAWTSGLCS